MATPNVDTSSTLDPGRTITTDRRSYWCSRAFVAAWIAYAGFTSCRRVVHWNPVLTGRNHFWETQLADLMMFFGIGYFLGQFVAGWAADRYGARRTLLFGGILSAILTFGVSVNLPLTIFCILQMLNGFAQAFGWPAISKLFSNWLPRTDWAIGFAWWSTSYVLGSFLFSALSRAVSTINLLPAYLSSTAPALILVFSTGFFYLRTKELPESVGLPSLHADKPPNPPTSGWKEILQNRNVRLLAVMYFFLKLTRSSLLFWLPLYLVEMQHYSEKISFSLSSLLELAGFLGALIAAYVSEKLWNRQRYSVACSMLYLAAFLFLLHPFIWAMGKLAAGVGIALIGILVWGPDLLMTSVAVLEAVPAEQVGRASGFVDGIGSVGQMISPLLITALVRWFGWNSIFNLFFLCTLIAASILAKNWNVTAFDGGHKRIRAYRHMYFS